jgi:SAM-dependent methyltransferase/uncharacterized protein YbaR (Trm112 family)
MTPLLLKYLCEPLTKNPLQLVNEVVSPSGNIVSGELVSSSGHRYPVINGIPRFLTSVHESTVNSFGNEWNYFNFTDHKYNWLNFTVKNTFENTDIFLGKLILDAGGGSGAQTRWFVEYGASHVILMDLSHSVDDVVQRNLAGLCNVDIIQCSIDAPPLRDESIKGIVYCHNVIQHTPSVEKTARSLFALTAPGGEFVFNCYQVNDQGILRWIRFHMVYKPMRYLLSRFPFILILAYARIMAFFCLIPGLGYLFEKSSLAAMGKVPRLANESFWFYLRRKFKTATLNTFDAYGSHTFQHHKTDDEILKLIESLQPDPEKVLNVDKYFQRPTPIGCALRIFK